MITFLGIFTEVINYHVKDKITNSCRDVDSTIADNRNWNRFISGPWVWTSVQAWSTRIAEADDSLFQRLEKLTQLKVIHVTETKWELMPIPLTGGATMPAGAVRLIESGRIGNLDFAVLGADDA